MVTCSFAVFYLFYQHTRITTHHVPIKITTQAHTPLNNLLEASVASQKKPQSPEDILSQRNQGVSAFDTKVRFWGKVLDQNQQPVEGATIKATVSTLRMIEIENGYREYEILSTQSAADGTFMFDGAEGICLRIQRLSKDGYVLPAAYQAGTRWEGSKYAYHYKSMGDVRKVFRPDSARPEIFHLWKLNNPEPLVLRGDWAGAYGEEFTVGASPTILGNISMMVTKVDHSQPQEWEITVTATEADGGVIKADPSDVFMFQAPETGYAHSITFKYKQEADSEMSDDAGTPVRFYVRSRNGRWYSARECAFFLPTQDGRVRTKMLLWTNPNGSRNLEHDAAHPLPEPSLIR